MTEIRTMSIRMTNKGKPCVPEMRKSIRMRVDGRDLTQMDDVVFPIVGAATQVDGYELFDTDESIKPVHVGRFASGRQLHRNEFLLFIDSRFNLEWISKFRAICSIAWPEIKRTLLG